MIEKVNPKHPDKLADRIAGALVDEAYRKQKDPKIAVEVLLGHGNCYIIAESSVHIKKRFVKETVERIVEHDMNVHYIEVKQDSILASNQASEIRCGDNGIFKGMPLTEEQLELANIARLIYDNHTFDGKYILANKKLVVCQSNVATKDLEKELEFLPSDYEVIINPLGEWTGGIDVDSGATNRKLGSDMADGVTGGGLHGKDLSKADVSVNIYAFLKAQEAGRPIELFCAIGDNSIDGKPYSEIVNVAREFINNIGGFEKFAEWGLY